MATARKIKNTVKNTVGNGKVIFSWEQAQTIADAVYDLSMDRENDVDNAVADVEEVLYTLGIKADVEAGVMLKFR